MSDTGSDNITPEFNRPSTRRVYSVTEVTRQLKRTLEQAFFSILVEGEISNFKRHGSGHLYFSIKDHDAQLSCVMWRGRSRNLHFRPVDGMLVRITGDVTIYERQGKMQLDVQHIMPVGEGQLQQDFEILKRQLADEGLFDSEHKKNIPAFPQTIGLVTSPSGAALRDIISVINRRYPGIKLILNPVRVQGSTAAAEISQAIIDLNEHNQCDLLIIGRGGGSLEDLWAFNEEIVARTIFDSEIPIISAVGHEVDFTISDFVADVRAPTPSAAAELAVPEIDVLQQTLLHLKSRLIRTVEHGLTYRQESLNRLKKSYGLRWPGDRLRENALRLDEITRKLQMSQQRRLEQEQQRLISVNNTLHALDPAAVLLRGYSITTDINGKVIINANDLTPGDQINTQLAQGTVKSTISTINREDNETPT
ncbi:exodeoxyribonuclease VII large subunit [bacterium]|nr:exodeoxyribonuclease VII large subunit [bacterium]